MANHRRSTDKAAVLVFVLAALAGTALSAADTPTTQPASTQPDRRSTTAPDTPAVLGFTMKSLDGKDVALSGYKGKVLLIVNVASRCAATPQYAGLEKLHEKYAAKGLAVLGMPCNQFGQQEPGAAPEIREFCQSTYDVKFDMFDKIEVNGASAAPLYRYLTGPDAPIADKGPVKWNFEKFLVGRDGRVIARYRTKVTPEQLVADIEAALGK